VLGREATNTNLIVFGLTLQGRELMIYGTLTRGEHVNNYITDVVRKLRKAVSDTQIQGRIDNVLLLYVLLLYEVQKFAA
jgi:hypothetical protein